MKYLILGSAGQIGEPLCGYLKSNGHEVITFDIVDSKKQDLRYQDALQEAIKDADFVVFLAFDVGGSRYLKKYQHTFDFINNNARIMVNTFEVLKEHNKPFIFTSSQMSNMSYSPYGALKSIGEYYTNALGGLVVKFWNVYGPEKNHEKSHVITDFILKAIKNKKIDMLTDGTEERQFLHATDCCRCLEILSARYDQIDREKQLHITSFEWNSIIEIANIVSDNISDVTVVPSIKKDDVQRDMINKPDKFILSLWEPQISIEEGIKDMIKFYSEEISK